METRNLQNRFEQDNDQTINAAEKTNASEAVGAAIRPPLVGSHLDSDTIDELARQLNEQEGEHQDPRWMTAADRDAVLSGLIRQANAEKKRQILARTLFGAGATTFIGLNIAYIYSRADFIPPLLFPFSIGYLISILCWQWYARRWGIAAARMARFDDVRAIGPLMEALDHRDKSVVSAAQQGLAGLLPRLNADDAELISGAQREVLYRSFAKPEAAANSQFLMASLQYIERFGDYRALRYIELVIERSAKSPQNVPVRDAALKCRDELVQLRDLTQSRNTLLRASDELVAQPETLLRPIMSVSAADPQQMLRAAKPD